MKNKKKFANEILETVINEQIIAIDKRTNKFHNCLGFDCKYCLFNGSNEPCSVALKKWAEREYQPPRKVFTQEEKEFVKTCDKIKYLTRDKSGSLYSWGSKPWKGCNFWNSGDEADFPPCYIKYLTSLQFEAITWEDDEPTSREEILSS